MRWVAPPSRSPPGPAGPRRWCPAQGASGQTEKDSADSRLWVRPHGPWSQSHSASNSMPKPSHMPSKGCPRGEEGGRAQLQLQLTVGRSGHGRIWPDDNRRRSMLAASAVSVADSTVAAELHGFLAPRCCPGRGFRRAVLDGLSGAVHTLGPAQPGAVAVRDACMAAIDDWHQQRMARRTPGYRGSSPNSGIWWRPGRIHHPHRDHDPRSATITARSWWCR